MRPEHEAGSRLQGRSGPRLRPAASAGGLFQTSTKGPVRVLFDRPHTRNLIFSVFSTILVNPGISRSEVAKTLGASASAVSKASGALVGGGLVVEQSPMSKGLGRPRTPLSVNPDREHVVGVHIGDQTIRAVLCDLTTTPIAETEEPIGSTDPIDLSETCATLVHRLLRANPTSAERVRSIGVSSPGHVDGLTGTLRRSTQLDCTEVPLAPMIERLTGLKALLHNDADVMALFQQWFGSSRGVLWAATVLVGPSVGCGLILDGDLYLGATSLAGSIGHVPVAGDNSPCGCGRSGCLEAVASDPAILRAISTVRGKGQPSTIDEAVSAAARGDRRAVQAFNHAGESLGATLATLANLVNPLTMVVLGRAVARCPVYREATTRAFEAGGFSTATSDVRLVIDDVPPDAWGRSAAMSVLRYQIVESLTGWNDWLFSHPLEG